MTAAVTGNLFASLLRPELAELAAYAPTELPAISVRLDANEAPKLESAAVLAAVARAVSRVPLERYPDAHARELKSRIAQRTGARPEELLVGSGSDEIISLLATSLARPRSRNPHAVVLAPTPTFVMYRVTARAHGLAPVEVPLDAAWDLDVRAMRRALEMMSPNIVFIASPNNPTGNRMSEPRLRDVLDAAGEALVVLDEAYVDYAAAGSLRALRAEYPRLAILRTLSKVGLAALRVGWIEADESLVREVDKARQPFNLSATSQAAASAVLADAWDDLRAHVATVVAERARVTDEISALVVPAGRFAVTPSDANFVWVKTPSPAGDVYDALARRGVLVRSFHGMGGRMATQLRITIGRPDENDRLLEALQACG